MEDRQRTSLRTVTAAARTFLESVSDQATLVAAIAKTVAAAVPDLCMVSLREGAAIRVVAMHDEDERSLAIYGPLMREPREISDVAAAALVETVFMPDLDVEALVGRVKEDSLDAMRARKPHGMLVTPLHARGELLGLITILRHRTDRPPLDSLDREVAENIASVAALAISNSRLLWQKSQLQSEIDASRFVDAILQNIPDMVFVKEAENLRFVRFNKAGEELLGLSSAQLIGKSDTDFFPPSEAEFFIKKDRETLAGKQLVDIPEEPIQTPAGQRWLHTKKVPILDAQGTPRYLLGISEDITERKRDTAALRSAVEQAQALNKELEAFSYSVAHDLRAPLRAIDGFGQALHEDYADKLDEIGRRHLERIRAAAQRMGTLIDDLLRLSRVTRAEHVPQLVSLSSLARIAVGQLERAEPDRHVEIAIEDNIEVKADPKLLSIALDNLFANAWKFTRKTDHPRIELGVQRNAATGERVFFVRDNGAGFDMQFVNKLFGTFSRLHPMHEFPGTGIGLATVKRIIERHGGRVWAEGAVGRGATFFFTLLEPT